MISADIFKKIIHSRPREEIFYLYDTDEIKGLSPDEAAQRQVEFGANSITRGKKKNPGLIFIRQFNSPLVYLLVLAAVFSYFFKEWLDGSAILVILFINSVIGFYMEYRAGLSMETLKKLSVLPAKVIRNGETGEINTEELVPGDMMFLEAGDLVPADGRVVRSSQLRIDEAILTGGAVPVEKKPGVLPESTPLAERTNMVYNGTFVTKGNAYCIITHTGMQTEFGKIANLVQSVEQVATPLEKKLKQFSKKLIKVTVVLMIIIFIAGFINGQELLEMLETAIALAIAAIPEGLPVVATLALTHGILKMARQNVIVKKLSAVETLGSTDVICTGKTGVLTPEVYDAIRECESAGIKVVMITGDHPSTARNIALQLGIIKNENTSVMAGPEMSDYEHLTEEEKDHWIRTSLFVRVTPAQKLNLVRVLQDRRHVVGMTGKGVNDAPALKKADIGIAMGLKGTQIAQEAAGMVLKDNSFSSIVRAIRQGRIIFDNIRKFVIYLLSCNLSELFVIAAAIILNLHFQLFPLQILYINVITDVLPAIALGVSAGSSQVMNQLPRDAEEPIIDNKRWNEIIFYSVIITLTTLGAVFISHFTVHKTETWHPLLCNNILFFTLIFSQILHVFNMNAGSGLFDNEVMKNRYVWYAVLASAVFLILSYQVPVVREALDVYPMSVADWTISAGMGITSLILIQISKRFNIVR